MANTNKYKILLTADDNSIRSLLATLLETEGYQVIQAADAAASLTLFASYQPDLVILDLGLPDRDGMEVLRGIRSDSLVPIIILSARADESDKVIALDEGANDYITKPFGSAELLARVRSTLRVNRHSAPEGHLPNGCFTLGDLTIDYDARQIFIAGAEVKLTQTEYNIVALLSEHSGKMMTYSAIIKAIWGYPDEGSVKKLQVNMANIRRKLGAVPGQSSYITNELGVGYRMNSDRE